MTILLAPHAAAVRRRAGRLHKVTCAAAHLSKINGMHS
jgi:hypothetical protein